MSNIYLTLGALHLAKGEFAKAREFYQKGNEVGEKAGTKYFQLLSFQGIILTSIELGEIEKIEYQIDSLQSLENMQEDYDKPLSADILRAMLFRAQKKWEKAIEFSEKSLQQFEVLNARRWNAYWFAIFALCEYARVYLERGQEGDREKARDLLNQALEMFQKMGAKKDVEKVEAKLLYIETGRVTSVPKPAEFVCTGHVDIDKLLWGGLRSSSAVVLTSPSCNERDSLIKSFLKRGTEKGEVTFYLTTSVRAAKTLTEESQGNSYVFVCNPKQMRSPRVHLTSSS